MIYWFNDSWTREFKLVTRGFELTTCWFELLTRGFELVTRGFELATGGFEFRLVLLSSQFVTRNSSLATRNLWLITRVLPYHPVASAVFWTTHLEAVFTASIPVFVAVSINFLTIFIAKFSCKGQKAVSFNVFSKFWFCWTSPLCNVTQ